MAYREITAEVLTEIEQAIITNPNACRWTTAHALKVPQSRVQRTKIRLAAEGRIPPIKRKDKPKSKTPTQVKNKPEVKTSKSDGNAKKLTNDENINVCKEALIEALSGCKAHKIAATLFTIFKELNVSYTLLQEAAHKSSITTGELTMIEFTTDKPDYQPQPRKGR